VVIQLASAAIGVTGVMSYAPASGTAFGRDWDGSGAGVSKKSARSVNFGCAIGRRIFLDTKPRSP